MYSICRDNSLRYDSSAIQSCSVRKGEQWALEGFKLVKNIMCVLDVDRALW